MMNYGLIAMILKFKSLWQPASQQLNNRQLKSAQPKHLTFNGPAVVVDV